MDSYPTPVHLVRPEQLGPHFLKLHLLDRQPLHYFTAPDTGPPHDHPWPFTSHVLVGGYIEEVYTLHPDGTHTVEVVERLPGTSHQVEAATVHRIIALPAGHCLTWVEPGPAERTSGFYDFRADGTWHRYWHEQEWRRLNL